MSLRKRDAKDMEALVARTKAALLRAVDQLTTDFQIYSIDFLPYEAHLIVLSYMSPTTAS